MDSLYNKSLDELNQMARDKGIKFSPDYKGPYKVREVIVTPHEFIRTCSPIDDPQNKVELLKLARKLKTKFYKVNEDELYTKHYHEKCIRIFEVCFGEQYFRCAVNQKKAEEFAKEMNKRHFIVAMESENPAFPVLI